MGQYIWALLLSPYERNVAKYAHTHIRGYTVTHTKEKRNEKKEEGGKKKDENKQKVVRRAGAWVLEG